MASYTDSPDEARGRRELTVAAAFLLLSVVVFYLPQGVQGQLASALRSTVLRPFLLTQETLAQARLRAEDAARLQAQLDSLTGVIVNQAPLVAEHRLLHELLELKEKAPASLVPASVIRPGTAGSESLLLLDVGSRQGVSPGDPVIMRDGRVGLVGMIREVRRGTSLGIDWSHPDFRASGMAMAPEVYGMVEPRRGLFREDDRLLLNGTPFYETLEPGTLVSTSGLGGVFPRGIPIGTIEELAEAEARWRKAYWIRPVVPTGSVTHVLVMVDDGLTEGLLRLFEEGGGS
jgi:rod shape-determining protein MreC